jgi:hypothetical protein
MSWASAVRAPTKRAAPPPPPPTELFFPTITPAAVDWDRLVSLDFETFFDTEYTLKKLSTSEYVRDPRFKVHMVGIKVGRGKTKVVPAARVAGELRKINWKTHSLLCHNTQFDGLILSHHFGIVPLKYYCSLSMARGLHSNEIGAGLDEVAKFYGGEGKIDGVLESVQGVLNLSKQQYTDMAVYCGQDVDEMHRIFREMHAKMPADEMDLIHITMRMFCDPVLKVDIPRVQKEYVREVARRQELMLSLVDLDEISAEETKKLLKNKAERQLTGIDRDMLMVKRIVGSNERFIELLLETGMSESDIPRKISPAWIKTPVDEREDDKKWAYAFAKDDLDFINLPERVWELFPELDPENTEGVAVAAEKSERLRQLVEVRIAVKSTTNITRAARFLEAGKDGMCLPVGYAYARAHTLRWGGNNKMNMQNLTRGGELRLSILAAAGHILCVVDSGQIEARVNGWLWGQDDLLDAFRNADTWDKALGVARGEKRDAYCRFADDIYGREITTDDKLERFVGKVCVLGLGYQMGPAKLQMTLAKGALGGPPVFFSLDQCKHIINTYRRRNYKITQGWEVCKEIIEDIAAGRSGSHKVIHWGGDGEGNGYIVLPNGMTLKYPDLRKAKGDKGWDEWTYQSGLMRKKIYGGLLCENLVQALARIIVGTQMLWIDKKYRAVMTTHDEVVAHAKKAQAEKCYQHMMKCMSTPLPWCMDIPLNCEGGWDVNYSK